jgi:hypothetical protein
MISPLGKDLEAAILDGLTKDVGEELFRALDLACEHPSPRVMDALFRIARDERGARGYGAAATLLALHGRIDSPEDAGEHRPLLLRVADADPVVRRAAFAEFCGMIGRDRR